MKIIKKIKKALFGEKEKTRRLFLGLYRGLSLQINPGSEIQLYLGLYERETCPWLSKTISKVKSAIDVGAGYGELTLWLLAQKNIEKVFAFEPDATRWPKFQANLAANPFLQLKELCLNQGLFGGQVAKETLRTAPEPVLLKIDIDGGEHGLLRELEEELRNKDVYILLEVHSQELNEKCRALLEKAGYTVSEVRKAWWRKLIPEQRPSAFNQWLVADPPKKKSSKIVS